MSSSNIQPENADLLQPGMAPDAAGCLYDSRARSMLDHLAASPDARKLEVFPAIRWCAARIQRFVQAEADPHGLTDGAARVLMQLSHSSDQPLGSLAVGMHVSPKNITILIDQLEKDGLVRRLHDPIDRRSIRAQLTDDGRRLVGQFQREFMTRSLELVDDITQEELERVRHICLLLIQRIDARLARRSP